MLSFTSGLCNCPGTRTHHNPAGATRTRHDDAMSGIHLLPASVSLSAASPEYTASLDSVVVNPSSTSAPGRSSVVSVIMIFMMSDEPFCPCTSIPARTSLRKRRLYHHSHVYHSIKLSSLVSEEPLPSPELYEWLVFGLVSQLSSMNPSVCWTCESSTGLPNLAVLP